MALADIRSDVRRLIMDMPLSDGISTAPSPASTGTTISFSNAGFWEQQDVVDFPDTGTAALITSASGANPFTIVRDHLDTPAGSITTAHRALKSPRFLTNNIDEAITRAAETAWKDGLYEVSSTTITPSPTTTSIYDLPSDYEAFVAMTQTSTASVENLLYYPPPGAIDELLNVPSGISSTNKALRVTSWYRTDANATLFYKAKISTATTEAQLQRIVSLLAADQLLGHEIVRKADRKDEQNRTQRIFFARREIREAYKEAAASWRAVLNRRESSPQRPRRFVR